MKLSDIDWDREIDDLANDQTVRSSVKEVYDAMTEDQKTVLHYIVGVAIDRKRR